ncbi:MAG: hypothetical protein IJU07_01215 [Synergistaceae bacterium]|nr:hypothetical protein [Synergistaceae bacterium]
MNNILEYKGYWTDIKVDFESHLLHGRLEGIKDLVNFESETIGGIIKEFHSAVDDYLVFCAELGETPNEPERMPEYIAEAL